MLLFVRDVVQEQPQPRHGGHELVIAFQRSVRFAAIDDRAGVLIKAHLVECKWAADHVAGEALSAFGIVAFAANAIVYREA